MGTRMCHEREVTDKLVEYHRVRAAGGVGLSIVEVSAVHAPSAPTASCPSPKTASSRGTAACTDAIHGEGGRAGIQLSAGLPSPSPWTPKRRSSCPRP